MAKQPDIRPTDWMRQSTIDGLVALIVGGGSGMGEAAAKTMAANGSKVVVADLQVESAQRVVSAIVAAGGKAVAVDVSKQADIDAAVQKTLDSFGRLDILVNTAVLVKPAALEDCSLDDWHACFRVNVDGALLLARSCLPHLRKSPSPAIVNVASLAGITGYPRTAAYGPSKAALITLSRQMALEWAVDRIRVNVVIPGTVDTPLTRHVRDEVLAERAQQIPLGRLGYASELGDLIVFLASPAASFITGQTVNCDGGFSQNLFAAPMGQTSARS
jgi:NAD(P)-dependent dehydrogenase (short-subunit alcohol dehydrogenase family)